MNPPIAYVLFFVPNDKTALSVALAEPELIQAFEVEVFPFPGCTVFNKRLLEITKFPVLLSLDVPRKFHDAPDGLVSGVCDVRAVLSAPVKESYTLYVVHVDNDARFHVFVAVAT
jgi:hypothetical protein